MDETSGQALRDTLTNMPTVDRDEFMLWLEERAVAADDKYMLAEIAAFKESAGQLYHNTHPKINPLAEAAERISQYFTAQGYVVKDGEGIERGKLVATFVPRRRNES